MHNLFILLFMGVILYLMFRRGGMGCCGGHGNHDSSDAKNRHIDHSALHKEKSQIIDLDEADYTILPSISKEK